MARRRVPVVGTRGVNAAQLSPELRALLKQRAQGAAQRAYAPEVAADKQAIGAVRQGYQNERSSILGATDMAENSLSQALRGLKSSGLSGRYLKQATSELTARQGDVAGSIPFLLSDAAQVRNEGLTEARQELTDTRAERGKSSAEAFNQLLKEQREKASTALGERAEEKEGLEFDPRGLRNADLALRDTLTAWIKNVPVEIKVDGATKEVPFQQANPLRTPSEWRTLAMGLVSEYGGFDAADALEVIRRKLRKRQEELRRVMRGGWSTEEEVSPFTRATSPIYQPFNAGE